MKRLILLFLVVTFLFAGCAYFINGKFQEMSISSSPSKATIFINGREVGRTPVIYALRRNVDTSIEIQLEGYKPYEILLNKKISNWFWFDLLFWGIIGIAVDYPTGTMYKFEPKFVDTNLSKDQLFIYITMELQSYDNLQKVGRLTKK